MIDAFTAWMIALGAFLVGALAAGGGTYLWLRRRYGDRESLHALRREYEAYQAEVRDHFVETAERVDGLTHAYKSVYDHLERGAYRLVGEAELRRRLQDAGSEPVTLDGIGPRSGADSGEARTELRAGADEAGDDAPGAPNGASGDDATARDDAPGNAPDDGPRR